MKTTIVNGFILDQRSKRNWPLILLGNSGSQISVNMAGSAGFNAVTSGLAGNGTLTYNNISYTVSLPGQRGGSANQVTFHIV